VPEKVLITGGTGFVGTHVREALDVAGVPYAHFARSEYDLARPGDADAVFQRHRDAGLVLHLACFQAAGDFPARFPADLFHVNHLIHANVLRAWKEHAPQARLIAVGSSCAYPGQATHLAEDRLLDGAIHGSVYAYAATKRALLVGLQAYGDQYGLDGTYVIPPTLFGEHDDFHADTAHVVGALVGRFVQAVRENAPSVEIWGDGTQVREFLYVKDFVRALLDLAGRCRRDVVNLGPGQGTSIRALAEMIRDAAGYRGALAFNPQRYAGIQEKVLDTRRLREKYGIAPPADLRPGLERTARWYQENYESVRGKRKFQGAERVLA
jgi:GDP-L-fucose synthase